MKIVVVDVRDFNNFIEILRSKGYDLKYGFHAVLLDHSELTNIKVMKNDHLVAIIIVHYITPYYRVEVKNIVDDDKYLRELISIKHSGEKWSIPVSPVIIILFDEEVFEIINSYRDDYPVEDGYELVNHYRRRNPKYKSVPQSLLARVLEELSFDT